MVIRLKGAKQMNHVKQQKREDAQARNTARAERSPETQMQLLDQRLGEGVGAAKERTRLRRSIQGGKA